MSDRPRRVLVTGVGALSPLGLDAESTWRGLIEGRSGIGPITHFDPAGFPSRIAGEVKGFDPERWLDPRDVKKFDRFVHFAVAATRMAIDDAGLDLEAVDRDRVAVVIGSGIGGMGLFERENRAYVERRLAEPDRPDKAVRRITPYFIPGVIINMASGVVSIQFGLRGPNVATVTACATGNHAIGDAFRMLRHGDADVAICGGAEGVITEMSVGGFSAMKALSTRNDEPERASRPFDRDRDGFVIAEGCGLLVLETEQHARARGARALAEIAGFGMSGDAYHISAPPEDGSGMVRVMNACLRDADLTPADVGYVNAHGTSTPTGDVIEAGAVRTVFGPHADSVLVSSTKSATGHLLGAAGGLEAVAAIYALARGVIPPTINLENQDPAVQLDCVPLKAREQRVDAVLSNSFGFGGTNATLAFKKP
ncbi:MAG: beta-ketoacyl-ACP synthase II [Acidobacteria bacterium]|nr:beta-ketoacyl-ACP synthase II [Acidobacteriota bacterium]